MADEEQRLDADILKGRQDILRARKAVDNRPPISQNPLPSSDKSHQHHAVPAEPSPLIKAVVDANKQDRTSRDTSGVPSFNVAQKILARQRQEAAAKRIAPLRTQTAKPAQPIPGAAPKDQIEQHTPTYNRVVAQIVARDIHRLCYA